MTLLESLVLTHLLADWLLQNEWQAVNKARNWVALLSHVAVYHAVLLAVLLYRFGWGDGRVYLVVGLLAVSHAILDRGWTLVWLMRAFRLIVARKPERWLTLAVDQSIHILLLGLAVLYLA